MPPKLKKGLAYRKIEGEMFVVDAAESRLHELNGPAALIWEGLAAGRDRERIVSSIVEEYETDAKTARADLDAFMDELLKARLAVVGDEGI